MKFDYIIVGAGSAGCVLANRLTENPEVTVLLLEAGSSDKKQEVHIPAAYTKLHYSEVDWGYHTVPQPFVKNRKMYQPRGKVLGGSSSTNCMAYIRGNKLDYDEWRDLGNPGWGYEDVLPYFKKAENNQQFVDQYHGQGGPLNITHATRWKNPLGEAFVNSCIESGIPANKDFNGAKQEGAGLFQFTIKKGKRHSTATAFLKPALKRKNLLVITEAHIQRVMLDNSRALGVEFLTDGALDWAYAEKEVILSAGAFNSPQILMLSGIGPVDQLKLKGISAVTDLPGVGQNLQDHLISGISALATKKNTLNSAENFWNILRYFLFKKGPFTTSPLQACAFLKTKKGLDRPDMQFHFAPAHSTDIHDIEVFPYGVDGFSILPTLLRPKSVGSVTLNSNNPMEAPVIDPNYFSDEGNEDYEAMMAGMRMARMVLESDAFTPFRKEIHFPTNYKDDKALSEHMLSVVETCYHPVGTCKMGMDSMAVVDSRLLVHGYKNLRVVDASIMPTVISGNTNAPVIMIAEKAADMIKQDSNMKVYQRGALL
ncbi:MAG: choline dehydrogenase [Bacteroidota bacterium]